MARLSDGPSQASSSTQLRRGASASQRPPPRSHRRRRPPQPRASRLAIQNPMPQPPAAAKNPTHPSARVRHSRTRAALAPGDTLHSCRRGLRPAQLRSSPKGPLSNGHHPPLQRLDGRPAPPAGLGARGGVSRGPGHRPPLSPKEAWLSDGRQVLHFRPSRWDRWSQQLEVTVEELQPGQPVPHRKRSRPRSASRAGCSPRRSGSRRHFQVGMEPEQQI